MREQVEAPSVLYNKPAMPMICGSEGTTVHNYHTKTSERLSLYLLEYQKPLSALSTATYHQDESDGAHCRKPLSDDWNWSTT
jgi:hypothetical protein